MYPQYQYAPSEKMAGQYAGAPPAVPQPGGPQPRPRFQNPVPMQQQYGSQDMYHMGFGGPPPPNQPYVPGGQDPFGGPRYPIDPNNWQQGGDGGGVLDSIHHPIDPNQWGQGGGGPPFYPIDPNPVQNQGRGQGMHDIHDPRARAMGPGGPHMGGYYINPTHYVGPQGHHWVWDGRQWHLDQRFMSPTGMGQQQMQQGGPGQQMQGGPGPVPMHGVVPVGGDQMQGSPPVHPQHGVVPMGGDLQGPNPQRFHPQGGLPNDPVFEAQRRSLEDGLAQELSQLGVAREQIPAMMNEITSRLQSQQGTDLRGLDEQTAGRGIYDSGVHTQQQALVNQGYDQQRADAAQSALQQFQDIENQRAGAHQTYNQGITEALLQEARRMATQRGAPISSVPGRGDYFGRVGGRQPLGGLQREINQSNRAAGRRRGNGGGGRRRRRG